jgi:P-type Ca2+ transporter type 2C
MAINSVGCGDVHQGLSSIEAKARLVADGPNELPRAGKRSVFNIVGEVLKEPMLALLLGGGVLYLLLGNLTEALILLAFATFSVVLTVVQETRTEHVLEALRDLSAPRALVIRDGQHVRIAGTDVVRGDILLLSQGDRIAADAALIDVTDLQVDESLLTGESLPVRKLAQDRNLTPSPQRPGGEDQPFIYSGSLVARGSGMACTLATGARTEIGKIGTTLATMTPEAPRLRAETTRIVRLFALFGAGVALAVVLLYGFTRGGWIDALLAGIAIGMAMLPEEFPVVLTIFLAMGASRIGRVGVLTRQASAIETLGSATVLCTDKTGTLTENKMAVTRAWLASGETIDIADPANMTDAFRELLTTSKLASAVVPVDPMEIAIHAAGKTDLPAGALAHTYGLRPDLLAMSNIWKQGDDFLIAAKGAPEAIARLCHLSAEAAQAMTQAVDDMAAKGIRVLGVATATPDTETWAQSQSDYKFTLVGLIGLADPLRASVPDAVQQCRAAGIKVVMITGDYAATAQAIAAHAGLADGDVITGPELEAMDAAALTARLGTVSVFARIMPEQKLRIVEAYKAAGEVVAMTGDGVNDAPSLKAAHIGIAMGKRGTDVAREASSIVLLDDDFGSIVKAIALGRRIYDNIRKAMAFIFAVHVPLAGLALLPLLFGFPILFGPIHIALIEMIIDPVCALVFEAEEGEENGMKRKPRDPEATLFSWAMIGWSVFQGVVAFALLAAVYLTATFQGMSETDTRALTFVALIMTIVALILVNRSFGTSIAAAFTRKNVALLYVLLAVAAVSVLIMLVPTLRTLLKFGQPQWLHFGVAAALGAILLLLLEALKPLANRVESVRT